VLKVASWIRRSAPRAAEVGRVDGAAVVERHPLAAVQPAPERALRYAELARPVRVEAAEPGVLGDREADSVDPVLGGEDDEVVTVPLETVAGADLDDVDRELVALDAEGHRGAEHLACALRAVERHRLGAVLEPHGPQESGDAEDVIGVVVGEEDFAEREADPVAHHLPLGALAAVEEEHLPFAVHREAGDVAVERRRRGAGAEEGDGEHRRRTLRTA
jgi:hypothetical protein